jgi:cytochrome c553
VARGRQLAEVGDESKLVQGCANCHGPQGSGSGAGYPYLAGQHAGYLASTLAAWRDGSRHNDPTDSMPVIAKSLNDADLQSVVAYYAGLPPPAQRLGAVTVAAAAAPAASGASAVVSGPRQPASASQATQGTGSEQGAPVTGGSQGPGGGGGGSGGGSTGSPTGQSTGGETKR